MKYIFLDEKDYKFPSKEIIARLDELISDFSQDQLLCSWTDYAPESLYEYCNLSEEELQQELKDKIISQEILNLIKEVKNIISEYGIWLEYNTEVPWNVCAVIFLYKINLEN